MQSIAEATPTAAVATSRVALYCTSKTSLFSVADTVVGGLLCFWKVFATMTCTKEEDLQLCISQQGYIRV